MQISICSVSYSVDIGFGVFFFSEQKFRSGGGGVVVTFLWSLLIGMACPESIGQDYVTGPCLVIWVGDKQKNGHFLWHVHMPLSQDPRPVTAGGKEKPSNCLYISSVFSHKENQICFIDIAHPTVFLGEKRNIFFTFVK